MPAYTQRSPSEALSPSVGPRWDRPTAISSDVWLRPKLHRWALPPPARFGQIQPNSGGQPVSDRVRGRATAGCFAPAGPHSLFTGTR